MSGDDADQLLAAVSARTGVDRAGRADPPVRSTGGVTTEMWQVLIDGGPVE